MGSGFPIKFVRVTQNHKVGFELLWRNLPLPLPLPLPLLSRIRDKQSYTEK